MISCGAYLGGLAGAAMGMPLLLGSRLSPEGYPFALGVLGLGFGVPLSLLFGLVLALFVRSVRIVILVWAGVGALVASTLACFSI